MGQTLDIARREALYLLKCQGFAVAAADAYLAQCEAELGRHFGALNELEIRADLEISIDFHDAGRLSLSAPGLDGEILYRWRPELPVAVPQQATVVVLRPRRRA